METQEQEQEKICKICHSEFDETNNAVPFIHPCKCKGSLKYMHAECLNEWISLSKKKKCEICNHPFLFKKTFKPDAPKNVPFTYVILFVLKTLLDLLLNILCSVYTISRLVFVILLATLTIKKFISPESSKIFQLQMGCVLTIFSYLNTLFIKKTIRALSSIRVRMESGNILENLINEVATRSVNESALSTLTIPQAGDSESNEFDEQVIIDNLDSYQFLSLAEILFRRPTWTYLKKDLISALSLSQFSIIIPVLLYFSKLVTSLFNSIFYYLCLIPGFKSKVLKHCHVPVISALITFSNSLGFSFLCRMCFAGTMLISILIFILYLLKTRTANSIIKIAFYLLKAYSIVILSSFYSALMIGLLSHFSFSYKINSGKPIFQVSNALLSICIHLFIGGFFTYLIREIKELLAKKFRTGLIISPPVDSSFNQLIEFAIILSFRGFLRKIIANFAILCLIPCSTILICTPKANFTFGTNTTHVSLLYYKAFLLLGSNCINIARFTVLIFGGIAKIFAKIFNAQNYFYNEKSAIPDKKQLVWALNTTHCSSEYLNYIDQINYVLKNKELIKNDLKEKNKNGKSISRKYLDFMKNCLGKVTIENNDLEEAYRRVNLDSTTLIKETDKLINSIENESDSTTNRTDTSFTKKVSKSLTSAIESEQNEMILKRYEFSDRRIRKYFGLEHSRRISIFYKPKHFGLVKMCCFMSCFTSILILISLILRISLLICNKIEFYSEESKSVGFMCISSLLTCLISLISKVFNINFKILFKVFLNHTILKFYTNFLFPVTASLISVLIYSNREFTAFSKIFITIFSFSTIPEYFFKNIFVASEIESYSPLFIIKQLASFSGLKAALFLLYLTYNRIVVFSNIYLPFVFGAIIVFQIYKISHVFTSGSLMEKVKDHFFLDKTVIANYNYPETTSQVE